VLVLGRQLHTTDCTDWDGLFRVHPSQSESSVVCSLLLNDIAGSAVLDAWGNEMVMGVPEITGTVVACTGQPVARVTLDWIYLGYPVEATR
jgi:hypothetical protein